MHFRLEVTFVSDCWCVMWRHSSSCGATLVGEDGPMAMDVADTEDRASSRPAASHMAGTFPSPGNVLAPSSVGVNDLCLPASALSFNTCLSYLVPGE